MISWVIKERDTGEYLGSQASGYTYCVGKDSKAAECFVSSEQAMESINKRLKAGQCANVDGSFYLIEAVFTADKSEQSSPLATAAQEAVVEARAAREATSPGVVTDPPDTLESRVAALEALFPTYTPTSPVDSKSFSLAELKNSVSWYCYEVNADMPTLKNNSDLWNLWEKAYWQGVEYAKECVTQSMGDIRNGK